MRPLPVAPLTRAAFQPYGDVLDARGTPDEIANGGAAEVFRELATADVEAEGGRLRFSVVRTRPRALPLRVEVMERHPLGSQLFSPLAGADWLVIVAPEGPLREDLIVAFRASPDQAVNYRRGVWHHPLAALDGDADFLIVERAGPGANLDLQPLAAPRLIS
jgi:ureidoglycolate lyase